MTTGLTSLIQKAAYLLAHKTTIWLSLVLLACSLSAWRLSQQLRPMPNQAREFRLARQVIFLHTGLTGFFWLANWLLN